MTARIKSRWFIALIVTALLMSGLALGFAPNREPRYQGWTLTQWLHDYYLTFGVAVPNAFTRQQACIHAVKEMGPEAIPFLLKKVSGQGNFLRRPSRALLRSRLIRALGAPFFRWPGVQSYFVRQNEEQFVGAQGFGMLGQDSLSALPALSKLSNHADSTVRLYALQSLQAIHSGPMVLPRSQSPEATAVAAKTEIQRPGQAEVFTDISWGKPSDDK